MTAGELRVESVRSAIVESVHRVSCAVADRDGRLLASSGDPERLTWWRSAAKPFQALPLVADGAADRFGVSVEELALVSASHSSEPRHLEVLDRLMARAGLTEGDLACGPHTPLSPVMERLAARGVVSPTPRWSNCSGKHAGMLTLARFHGWTLQGYQLADHPVQRRVLDEIVRWTGARESEIRLGVDGCTAVCFALPIVRMALAYARLGSSGGPAQRIAAAMMTHPELVAGRGRLCTDLMAGWPGRIVAKIGAEGVYCAALPEPGIGLALKIEDGDMLSAPVALLEALRQSLDRLAPALGDELARVPLTRHRAQPIRNTRGETTGERRAAGGLRFYDC